MKKIVFSFLGVLMLGLSSCLKTGDNIQTFDWYPGIVDFSDLFLTVLNTPIGHVTSQGLINSTELNYGDAVIASFQINFDIQTQTDYYTASDLVWDKIDKGWAQATEKGKSTGDFDLPIEAMWERGYVGYYFFFLFTHKDVVKEDAFKYEMTYDINEPVIYLRAQKNSSGSKASGCAFDMYSFFQHFKDSNNNVSFDIFYQTAADKYEKFNSTPIVIRGVE